MGRARTGGADGFIFNIDEVTDDGKIVRSLGGANHVMVAQAAFRAAQRFASKTAYIQLRQGYSVLNVVRGLDEEDTAILERLFSHQPAGL